MRAPVLLFACFGVEPTRWRHELKRALPELEVRQWPDVGDPCEIDYVLLWNHPSGFLKQFPNLRAIFAMGAGVDRQLLDPDLPAHIPLVRMADPGLAVFMKEYVLMRVLHYHRDMPAYEQQQRAAQWRQLPPRETCERRVGVMGIGRIGGTCARALAELGFAVRGWARSEREIPGVTVLAGQGRLREFLSGIEILICLLPLTAETRGILNAEHFALLAPGASLIHLARGAHLVEVDLLQALDSGQLAGATLDVFATEPLPREHPFWRDPRITITPHASALTRPETAVPRLAHNIARERAGQPMLDLVDRAAGY
jgi:glyoxylate/hydroxypyruvate reductase A